MRTRRFLSIFPLFLVIACSGQTVYRVLIDALSFIPKDQLHVISPVPDGIGLTIYILPGVYLDLTASGPDESTARGIEVSAPIPGFPPEDADLKMRIVCRIRLENLDAVSTIPGSNVDILIARRDASQIYAEGMVVESVVEGPLAPGSSQVTESFKEISSQDPSYSLIEPGVFRVGISVRVEPAPAATVDVRYTIEELHIEVTARPFGLIP